MDFSDQSRKLAARIPRYEEKLLLTTLDDLYTFAPRFKAAVAFYIAGGQSNGVDK